MDQKTDNQTMVSVPNGILFLVCNWILVFCICMALKKPDQSNFTVIHTFTNALAITSILAIIIYVLLTRKSHFEQIRRRSVFVLLLILVNVSAFFIGRFNYQYSIKNTLSAIEESHSIPIQMKLKNIDDQIKDLSQRLQGDPQDKEDAKERIMIIDKMFNLQEESYAISKNIHENILLTIKKNSILKPAELKRLLKKRLNINIDFYPEFRKKYEMWYGAVNSCLSAKKDSYQSYINDEDDGYQALKIRRADNACSYSTQRLMSMTEAQLQLIGTNP